MGAFFQSLAATALGAWLIKMAWPLLKKALVMLGIGFVAYSGMTLISNQIKDEVINQWGNLGGATLQIMTLAGVPQSIGIILSAIAASAGLAAAAKMAKLT